MSAIDIEQLGSDIVSAIKGEVDDKWPEIKDFAETQGKILAQAAADLAELRAQGKIGDAELKLHLDLQKQAAKQVLLAVEGMGILMVEAALNAAIKVINAAIEAAIG